MTSLELFRTNVGSHMWKMNHAHSDIDLTVVYLAESRDILIGKNIKGKQKQDKEANTDIVYYELGHLIQHILYGNVNFIWAVTSPIVILEYRSALKELKDITMNNLSKNCYRSINGLATHNMYHFIEKGDRESLEYKKKLNVIGRTLKFGINLLAFGKCLYDKVNIQNEEELWDLQNKLNESYRNSVLPEYPNSEPFYQYLIKWRIKKMELDGLI